MVSAPEGFPELRVTNKKNIGFYLRAASSFLKGVEAKDDKEAKPAVDGLKISGMGLAINAAIAAAGVMEKDKLATIEKIETNYIEVEDGKHSCAQVEIILKRVK